MIHVVLKNRKVLRYNAATNAYDCNGIMMLEDGKGGWCAQIPVENIERIDGVKPCQILKARPGPKKANY